MISTAAIIRMCIVALQSPLETQYKRPASSENTNVSSCLGDLRFGLVSGGEGLGLEL